MIDDEDDGALLLTIDGRTAAVAAGATDDDTAAVGVAADDAGAGFVGFGAAPSSTALLLTLVRFNAMMWVCSTCFTPGNVAARHAVE